VDLHKAAIWILDVDGKTVYANAKMGEILLAAPAEMIGQSVFFCVFHEDLDAAKRLFQAKESNTNSFHVKAMQKGWFTCVGGFTGHANARCRRKVHRHYRDVYENGAALAGSSRIRRFHRYLRRLNARGRRNSPVEKCGPNQHRG